MKPRHKTRPEPLEIETNWAKRSRQEKRQRIDAMLREIRSNRPWWASEPPWRVDEILANGGDKEQGMLFDD